MYPSSFFYCGSPVERIALLTDKINEDYRLQALRIGTNQAKIQTHSCELRVFQIEALSLSFVVSNHTLTGTIHV